MGRKRDFLWEELVAVCGADPDQMTTSERGRYNKALRQLREVGATPESIRTKANAYRAKWPGIDVTPTGLAANWSTLRPPPSRYKDYVPTRIISNDEQTYDDEQTYEPLTPEQMAENRKRLARLIQGIAHATE